MREEEHAVGWQRPKHIEQFVEDREIDVATGLPPTIADATVSNVLPAKGGDVLACGASVQDEAKRQHGLAADAVVLLELLDLVFGPGVEAVWVFLVALGADGRIVETESFADAEAC